MTGSGQARDGSPVAVYLALPAGEGPLLVDAVAGRPATILELGCGAGRMTRVLVALGHTVTAVDDDPQMLRHVTGARTVRADARALDLGERFDVVLAASHLVDDPDSRETLLRVCAAHVAPHGAVVVERYEQAWARRPGPSDRTVGAVRLTLAVGGRTPDGGWYLTLTYSVGQSSWTQSFTAVPLPDALLDEAAERAGLVLDRWLDDERTWAVLRPASRTSARRASGCGPAAEEGSDPRPRQEN